MIPRSHVDVDIVHALPQLNGPTSRQMWERQNLRSTRAGHGDPDNNIPRAAVHYFAPGMQYHTDLLNTKHLFSYS